MRVGFLLNGLDNRGTGNAVFDYAHYNEVLLRNESKIYTFRSGVHSPLSVERFRERFGNIPYIESLYDASKDGLDVLYHIKSGAIEPINLDSAIRYAVHSVFEIQPHGDKYAAVSEWLADGKVPFVPHVIDPVWSNKNFREFLGINKNDLVIGRHGGYDTFDIPFVWNAVSTALDKYQDLHFVLLNTEEKVQHPRIHYLPESGPIEKRIFINTCDAMLHARARGETFGISVGEFAVFGKPVMTYSKSPERAHIEELGENGLYYESEDDIMKHIDELHHTIQPRFAYMQYSPNGVMKKFKSVFLD